MAPIKRASTGTDPHSDKARIAGIELAQAPPGEEICITGASGMFPDSDNLHQFRDNLYNKYDMVTADSRRWELSHPEIPQRTGKVNNINRFDAAFFGVHYKQAHSMDPMCRKLLEKTYEAIVDAGVNPAELKGTNTGVFIGACFSESEKTWFYEKLQAYGFGITGCSRAMLANRISYWLGIYGPSYTVDSACSSSLYALEHAYKAIRDGECDQAIVGGSNLCLHPYLSLQFNRLGVLSPQGMCKSFDYHANGYARSEAISVLYLQKTRHAKRIYATVVYAKTNCDGYKEQGITYPSGLMQRQLLEEFYEECAVDPTTLAWVEAHGTGTRVGDPEELNALDAVFCKGRKTPLPIGSVKSNIGHSEPASGLCSVAKVLIAMETGLIPPNLHYKAPREGVRALAEGTLQVVTEPQPWDGGLVGINSFGFGGANAHVLLRWNPKLKVDGGAPLDGLPRLVAVSARTERGVQQLLDDLARRPVDAEHVALFHEVHSIRIPGHIFRGFAVLKPGHATKHVQYFDGQPRPLVLAVSGLGSRWRAMGKALMRVTVFAGAIDKCAQALKTKGLNLLKIVTEDSLDKITNASVAITAVQIGLIEVLRCVGACPDVIVGHAIGELAAAYADDCLTAEQAVLAAYYRGVALEETDFVPGAMAHIEMSVEAARPHLGPDMELSCVNGPTSLVVSGPAESVNRLLQTLAASGVKAGLVDNGRVAENSRYVAGAGPTLVKYLRQVIPTPKLRSDRWLSTSLTPAQRKNPLGRVASAEYFGHALLGSVRFDDAIRRLPGGAVIVEVAPHAMLAAAVGARGTHVPMMQRGLDGVESVLAALGELFELGWDLKLSALYPPTSFPVSRSTPMISPLIDWNHEQDWFVTRYELSEKFRSGERGVVINIASEDSKFYKGHVVDGRNLFPATGYLLLAWETLRLLLDKDVLSSVPVIFENVRFHRATNLPKDGSLEFIVMVQKGSGNFEVVEGGAAIVTGHIRHAPDVAEQMTELEPVAPEPGEPLIPLTSKDIYKELRLRGYNYSGLFRSILSADNTGTRGKVRWANNWVAFMDNMLQMQIITEDTRGLFVPTAIERLCIDPTAHIKCIEEFNGEVLDKEKDLNLDMLEPEADLDAFVHREIGVIRAGGVEIRGLTASAITRRKPLGEPVVEKYQFVPNDNALPVADATLDLAESLRVCIHVALENQFGVKVRAVELVDEAATAADKPLLAPTLAAILGDLPLIQADILVLAPPEHPLTADLGTGISVEDKKLSTEQSSCMFVLGTGLLARPDILATALVSVSAGGFIVSRETVTQATNNEAVIALNEYVVGDEKIVLLKKALVVPDTLVIHVSEKSTDWIAPLQDAMRKDKSMQRVLLVAQGEPMSGILGLFNCIRKEPGGAHTRCYFILDASAPPFDPALPFYDNQVKKDVAVNVLKDGRWGSYRHLALGTLAPVEVPHAYVNNLVRGDLSSFRWLEGHLEPKTFKPTGTQELVQVFTAALNFRDVMVTTGKLAPEVIAKGRLNQECVIGLEFAGLDSRGRRVMGKIASGAMASAVVADSDLLWEIPNSWTFEDAATVPVVYGTAYYALSLCGRMAKGDSVLIHAGSGGVGQAAIYLALFEGCTVFTTVGTQEKRDFIKKQFPMLTDSHIGNSRDTSFEQLVMRETGGRGVDLVLNSLAEEKLLASVRCLAVGGRFLEIGKFDLAANNPLGMEVFLKETSFHGIMLDNLFHAPSEWKRPIHDIMTKGIREGAVRPLSRTVFGDQEIEQAFRFMAAGKHIGKVLLKLREEEKQVGSIIPEFALKKAIPRFLCHPDRSYIIAGGLGGFGLELADWLVLRGARNLVLTSRSGVKTGYQAARMRTWRSYGARVDVSTADIATASGVTALLQHANAIGPVDAIFNLAVVLLDAFFENQTAESFAGSAGPKADATRHMDEVSRRLCPNLRHFVVFSSVSCGRGNAGQANYGMSNSVMERICERRKAEGLPALAVQWGAVGEVGLVAEMQEEQHELVIGGTLQQRIASCLHELDGFLRQSHPVVASMVVAEKRAGSGGASNIVDCVVNILGLRDLKTVSLHSSLAELGMDSMMAVEIKQTLEREFEVFLSAQDIRGLTFAKLADLANAEPVAKDKAAIELNIDGIQILLRAIGEEADSALASRVLPSLTTGPGFDLARPVMFLVPGIEGMASVLEPLARNLKSTTVGLQLGYNSEFNLRTCKEMAATLLPHIKSSLEVGAPFNILGYSFGGLVALELAFLLEQDGFRGQLFLLDGSPEFLRGICKNMLVDGSEDQIQISLLNTIMQLIKKQDAAATDMIRTEMLKLPGWSERLEYFLTLVPESKYNSDYIVSLADGTLKRIQAVIAFDRDVTETAKLKSKVTLIRPNVLLSLSAEADQGISTYCASPAEVHFVDGDHSSILQSMQVASIINNIVDAFVTEHQASLIIPTKGKTSSVPNFVSRDYKRVN